VDRNVSVYCIHSVSKIDTLQFTVESLLTVVISLHINGNLDISYMKR